MVAGTAHPGPPPRPVAEAYDAGFAAPVSQALATAGYGWHDETSLHALRMIVGGVFDRLAGLKVIGDERLICRAARRRSLPGLRRPTPW